MGAREMGIFAGIAMLVVGCEQSPQTSDAIDVTKRATAPKEIEFKYFDADEIEAPFGLSWSLTKEAFMHETGVVPTLDGGGFTLYKLKNDPFPLRLRGEVEVEFVDGYLSSIDWESEKVDAIEMADEAYSELNKVLIAKYGDPLKHSNLVKLAIFMGSEKNADEYVSALPSTTKYWYEDGLIIALFKTDNKWDREFANDRLNEIRSYGFSQETLDRLEAPHLKAINSPDQYGVKLSYAPLTERVGANFDDVDY